jgi:ferredoxin
MELVKLLGFNPQRIGTIKHLSSLKGEVRSTDRIELRGEPAASFNLAKFKFPSTWYFSLIPRWLVRFLGSFIWLKPEIVQELCTSCMMCVNSCPVKAITKSSPTDKPVVVTRECISCLCCHELCLSKAVELRKSPLAKLLIRG